jgi:hypothetical protein
MRSRRSRLHRLLTVAPWTILSSRVAIASRRCLPSALSVCTFGGRVAVGTRLDGPVRADPQAASASPTAAPPKGLNNAAPSVRLHYRAAELLRCYSPAPVPIGIRPSGDLPLESSLRIRATGSHVPYKSPVQNHAASMPDAIWAEIRTHPTIRSAGLRAVPGAMRLTHFYHYYIDNMALSAYKHPAHYQGDIYA